MENFLRLKLMNSAETIRGLGQKDFLFHKISLLLLSEESSSGNVSHNVALNLIPHLVILFYRVDVLQKLNCRICSDSLLFAILSVYFY